MFCPDLSIPCDSTKCSVSNVHCGSVFVPKCCRAKGFSLTHYRPPFVVVYNISEGWAVWRLPQPLPEKMRPKLCMGIQNGIRNGRISCLFSNEPFKPWQSPVMIIQDFNLCWRPLLVSSFRERAVCTRKTLMPSGKPWWSSLKVPAAPTRGAAKRFVFLEIQ